MRILGAAMCQQLGLALLITTALAGCGGEEQPEPVGETDPMPAEVEQLFPSLPAAEAAWAGASDFQRNLLRDGELSFGEYESAVLALASCASDEGITFAKEPTYNTGTRRFEYSVIGGATTGEAAATETRLARCESQYVQGIQGVWVWLHRSTELDLQKGDAALRACLAEWGDDQSDIAAVPPYGSEKYVEWSIAKKDAERREPSTEAPAWLRCTYQIEQEYPLG